MITNLITTIQTINSKINGVVWGVPMLCLIIFVGIFYTILTKCYQITHVKEIYENTIKGVFKKSNKKNKLENNVITQFQALSTALAATIGTGNITGVATAIFFGGPGAIFWMWICAIFGMATHFAEITLGIYYRKKDKILGYSGGAMYYLEYGIGHTLKKKHLGKVLAVLFAFFTFIASFGIGNMTQINSIAEALNTNFSIPTIYTGVIIAFISAVIIIGGITRIGKVTERIVPLMSLFYIIIGLIIIISNIKQVPFAFYSIFSCAFSTKAIAGGALGFILKRAMTYGFKRGAFSNEAGLGSSVIAHSASNTTEPIKQGMWGIFEVFFDTIIVCTFTALIILSSTINTTNLNTALTSNITIDPIIATLDTNSNENYDSNNTSHLVSTEIHSMPIKLDENNNATLYKTTENLQNFYPITVYGESYFVESVENTETPTDDNYFFGNIIKINANPIKTIENKFVYDDNGNPLVDSIHIEKVNGVSLVSLAISSKLTHFAGKLIAIAVSLFAFSTVLGWSYYGVKSIEYLGGKLATTIYKILYIAFIVIGSTIKLELAWNISDTLNGLMALPNLIGLIFLWKVVIKILKNYNQRKKNKNLKPDIAFFK